jgi:putative peptide zinc metalloprotease protein
MTASLPRVSSHPGALPLGERAGLEGVSRLFASRGGQVPVHRPPLPRLRTDLIISQQVTAEGVIFVIKDPLLDRFYRFPEQAHFIASQLDGKTELEVVRKRTEEKFRTSLPPEQLTAFLGTLTAAGLLDTGKDDQARRPARRIQGSLLYLRFRIFDPDRLFNYLIDKIQFFFTPQFLVLSAVTILSAVCVAFANWGDVVQNFPRLLQWWVFPVAWIISCLVVTLHEFGHGMTCKHFGGEVHELGFMLIYFSPALYVNVSDAWLFPEKSKRLWVGFAGPYFELFVWALATWVWRLTNMDTIINFLAFIVMLTSGVKTLFNFNPVIKLDGYYLLSDWLEIPNLRAKGFNCLNDTIQKLFGAKVPRLEQMLPRERRILLAYGLVAGVGSIWLLGYALVRVGGSILHDAHPMAFVLPAGFICISLRDLLRQLFGKSHGPAAKLEDPDAVASRPEKPAAPAPGPESPNISNEPEGGNLRGASDSPKSEEPIKTNRKQMPRAFKRLLKLAVIGGATAVVLIFGRTELKIKGSFDVLPVHNADVRAGAEGIIEEVYVAEGQTVQQGELIASLFDRDVRAELQKTEAAIAEAKAKLRLLVAGPRLEEIEQARIEVAKDAEAIVFATSRLGRDAKLFDEKLVSKQELENSEENLAQRKSEAATAKAKLEVLLAGSRPEEIEAMKDAIASLESQRRYLDEQLRLMRVVSPASGVVATPARQLMAMKHQLVKKGDLIAKVFDLKTITAEMAVSEGDIADVKVDQKVLLKVRAYPERTFYGKVKAIAIAAQGGPSSTAATGPQGTASANSTRNSLSPRMVTVTTEIENRDLLLKPDMSGQGKVFCGERRLLDLVIRRIARTVRVEFWSWW